MNLLFLRSYPAAHFYAPLAGALRGNDKVKYMQYPPLPPDLKSRVRKLYNSEKAWEDLHTNLIRSRSELEKRLSAGEFDMVLLADDDAHLFRIFDIPWFRWKTLLECAVCWIKGQRSLAWAAWQYANCMPCGLEAFADQVPVVGIENCDAACLTPRNRRIFEASKVYFKRELPYDRLFMYYPDRPAPWKQWRQKLMPMFDKVHGISMGIEDEKYADLKARRVMEQDIDVLITGVISNSTRQVAEKRLRAMQQAGSLRIVIAESMPFDEYCDLVARSRVTVSIAGSRWECFRHFEAVALGSVPLMNRPTVDAVSWDLAPDAVFFENNFSNFESRIETLCRNEGLRTECLNRLRVLIETKMLSSRVLATIVATAADARSTPSL